MSTSHHALAQSIPSAAPPSEFRIWPFGEIATTKGTFVFDELAARSVMEAFASYGNRLTIDYEHKAVDPNRRAGDGKAAGSFVLELRADGLYAVDVRWTPPAARALLNKEWLYFSPYFSAEEESGRIVEVINLALTNIPATKNLQPLVAAHRSQHTMDSTNDAGAVTASADPPVDQEETSLSEPDVKARESAKKSARSRLAKARAELDAAKAECAAFGDDEDEAPDSEREEDDEEEEEETAVPPKQETTAATSRSARGKSRIEAAARAATGKDDEEEILGALTALSQANRSNVSLGRRVADLERKLRKSEVESLVTNAIKAGKIAPAEREWALGYGMENPGKLRGYLDVTPPRVAVATERREPNRPVAVDPKTGAATVALSDEERRICANTGIDPEKFAAVKNRPIRSIEG